MRNVTSSSLTFCFLHEFSAPVLNLYPPTSPPPSPMEEIIRWSWRLQQLVSTLCQAAFYSSNLLMFYWGKNFLFPILFWINFRFFDRAKSLMLWYASIFLVTSLSLAHTYLKHHTQLCVTIVYFLSHFKKNWQVHYVFSCFHSKTLLSLLSLSHTYSFFWNSAQVLPSLGNFPCGLS